MLRGAADLLICRIAHTSTHNQMTWIKLHFGVVGRAWLPVRRDHILGRDHFRVGLGASRHGHGNSEARGGCHCCVRGLPGGSVRPGHQVPARVSFVLEKNSHQISGGLTFDIDDGDGEVVACGGRLHAERREHDGRKRGAVAVLRLVMYWDEDGVAELLFAARFGHLVEGIAGELEEGWPLCRTTCRDRYPSP
jgi:hypothetical protein